MTVLGALLLAIAATIPVVAWRACRWHERRLAERDRQRTDLERAAARLERARRRARLGLDQDDDRR